MFGLRRTDPLSWYTLRVLDRDLRRHGLSHAADVTLVRANEEQVGHRLSPPPAALHFAPPPLYALLPSRRRGPIGELPRDPRDARRRARRRAARVVVVVGVVPAGGGAPARAAHRAVDTLRRVGARARAAGVVARPLLRRGEARGEARVGGVGDLLHERARGAAGEGEGGVRRGVGRRERRDGVAGAERAAAVRRVVRRGEVDGGDVLRVGGDGEQRDGERVGDPQED
mmetsp:Transcript_17210/g.41111  ORF Transcript_17210/g.41111 Transcript_17210/m.41111 type:complete len:228 (-) Transcript_17210:126-809(-)